MAVTIEADGTTCRAGTTVWTLPDGERLTIDAAPYDGVISEHHGVGVVDSICELERNGLPGFVIWRSRPTRVAGRCPSAPRCAQPTWTV